MIYTGYFAKMDKYPTELERVSIARFTPKGINIRKYEKLMPSQNILTFYKNTGNESDYRDAYNAMLMRIDVDKVADDLENCILLCYEKPESFCHRHLVSAWFTKHGIECKEYLI